VNNAPTKEEIEYFWAKKVFGRKVQHNENAYQIKNKCQKNPSI